MRRSGPLGVAMLCLGADLTYVDGSSSRRGSDKFYTAVMAGTAVHVRYGRRGPQAYRHATYRFATAGEAAAHMWKLLREKTAKGYHVVDAAVFDVDHETVNHAGAAASRLYEPGMHVVFAWTAFSRGERAGDRQAVLRHPVLSDRSPRTPKVGKDILLSLINPNCPEGVLVDCATAAESERFLPPMAVSHPACTDEVRVARFLTANAVAC